ncbi:ComEA family DNA-binding protein [Amycolatopsis alkalitolerans]|uniref:Helix-hairpin-helix domain-containing protein n=1 Tax=Amycolatopsis alkalitolerans TaxID=2547244 RepID=A0A5C4LYT6_9PSEU|nr:helix-hairpin-helix domain-containing protein [Amycolatopsis alkalitolerans]TNC24839.1 hypothetical protein FG385_16455 [Amycolatopsis alkalitolerans]
MTSRYVGWWYLPVTILSAGLLAWVPVLHAAGVLSRRRLYWWTLAYAAAAVASVAAGSAGAAIALVTIIAGSVHQLRLRRERIAAASAPPPAEDPAVARALAARARRQQARELAARDPLLAKELHIGRPDLPGDYDDGGLVELNTAPAETLARRLGLDPAQAQSIVDARASFGGAFSAVDDVFAATELPLDTWDLIRDRAIILG